jgi:signal transduction histidine kinase
MAWFNQSLERQSALQSSLTILLTMVTAALVCWRWPLWWVCLLAAVSCWLIGLAVSKSRQQILSAFRRASVQLDALQLQDYSLQAKPAYTHGIAAEFQQQLQQLATQLQQRKSFFDEQQFLLYRLIDQLNTPILVLNHKAQLSYANGQFQLLFGQPWQSLKHSSAASLGKSVIVVLLTRVNVISYWCLSILNWPCGKTSYKPGNSSSGCSVTKSITR